MKYNYRAGAYEPFRSVLSRFVSRVVLFTAGGVAGAVAGLYVVVGEIQASVQPIVTQDSGNVLPIVHALQQNDGLYVVRSVSSTDDLQPVGGYNVIQRTERVQP